MNAPRAPQWKGYPHSANTWEPEDNVRDGCEDLIAAYMQTHDARKLTSSPDQVALARQAQQQTKPAKASPRKLSTSSRGTAVREKIKRADVKISDAKRRPSSSIPASSASIFASPARSKSAQQAMDNSPSSSRSAMREQIDTQRQRDIAKEKREREQQREREQLKQKLLERDRLAKLKREQQERQQEKQTLQQRMQTQKRIAPPIDLDDSDDSADSLPPAPIGVTRKLFGPSTSKDVYEPRHVPTVKSTTTAARFLPPPKEPQLEKRPRQSMNITMVVSDSDDDVAVAVTEVASAAASSIALTAALAMENADVLRVLGKRVQEGGRLEYKLEFAGGSTAWVGEDGDGEILKVFV